MSGTSGLVVVVAETAPLDALVLVRLAVPALANHLQAILGLAAEWLVLPLAVQQGKVPFALQQERFESWDRELNDQSGGTAGHGKEGGVHHVGDWGQGVVEVCC